MIFIECENKQKINSNQIENWEIYTEQTSPNIA